MAENNSSPDINNREPTSKIILNLILDDLNDRKGFKQEYANIDNETQQEIRDTLTEKIQNSLDDSAVPQQEKVASLVKTVIDDLSDRRGLRQGFFGQLLFSDEAVREYKQENPGADITEDDSIPGISRQLTNKVQPFITPSNP